MNSSTLKYEGWLYGLAFLIAIGFRYIQLGAAPLTDSEAALALQALGIARGESPLLSPQPAYILFTSIFFAVIESTNFLARFIPALVGSILVFVPYFFRDKLHPRSALILAFLFAFDPGLVAFSRQANSTILAVTFLLFTWGMWRNARFIPAGIFAGLALLSGPSLWAGLLSLALTWFFLSRKISDNTHRTADQSSENSLQSPISNSPISTSLFTNPSFLVSLVATLLLGGTLFFIAPNGLSAWLSSIPAYFTGWVTPTITTPARMLLIFGTYEALGIFLTILACIRGFRTKSMRYIPLMLWLAISLLLAVFYRQPSELLWVIIPLLTLSAFELSRTFEIRRENLTETGVVTGALLILLAYIWFNIAGIALDPFNQIPTTVPILGPVNNPRMLVLFGSLTIIVVSIALIAFGWSARIARLGAIWSFTIFFCVYAMASAWGSSGLRSLNGVELWTSDSQPLQADLFMVSVDDISEFSLGHTQSQPVTVFGIASPALEWSLRNHAVEVVSALDPQNAPPIVITPVMNDLGLPSAYRGQDFTWRQYPQWDLIKSPDWIKWIVFRQLPVDNETIILWARNDLFPDAREGTQP